MTPHARLRAATARLNVATDTIAAIADWREELELGIWRTGMQSETDCLAGEVRRLGSICRAIAAQFQTKRKRQAE